MRRTLPSRLPVAAAAVVAAGVLSAPVIASAAPPDHAASHAARAGKAAGGGHFARPALPAGERYVCPPAPAGQMTCMSIIKPTAIAANGAMMRAASPQISGDYLPAGLRQAYRVATYAAHNARGRTVAIVDAFSDPHAAADLSRYRSTFHLPACTISDRCLHIYNEWGTRRTMPAENKGWAVEEALDLDMVSAICPLCHIDLIEAKNSANTNLGVAEDTAARKARFVSNSWGNSEFPAESRDNHYFNHPGHVIDFAAGDLGYGSTYPASLQYVTSVGGTSLRRSGNRRGWTESVWGTAKNNPKEGTASGCSEYEAKPSWQRMDAKPGECARRTENDAAAVANPNTGVIIYTSIGVPQGAGFYEIGGTSASTPIITAIYALAGNPVVRTYPAQYPYLQARHLFDVRTGVNGACGSGALAYLCHAERGFDGPTGLGTPAGIKGFHIRAVRRVTLVDPGGRQATVGKFFRMTITGLDTKKVSKLRYTATGVPPGLSIHAIPHSTNGTIKGRPTTAGTYNVDVTAYDGRVRSSTHFAIIVSG